MYRNLSVKFLGTAAALSLMCSVAAAAEWRAWNIHHKGHPNTAAMDRFAELVKKNTKGKINVQVFHGGVLGSQPDAIEQVRGGAIEIGNFNLGPIGPVAPAANVVSLPFIFKDVPHMFRVLEGEGGEMIADGDVVDTGTLAALDEHLDGAVRQLEKLQDRRQRADIVKILGLRIVQIRRLLSDQQDALAGVHCTVKSHDRPLSTHEQRNHHVRIDHDVAERQYRDSVVVCLLYVGHQVFFRHRKYLYQGLSRDKAGSWK